MDEVVQEYTGLDLKSNIGKVNITNLLGQGIKSGMQIMNSQRRNSVFVSNNKSSTEGLKWAHLFNNVPH